MSEFNRREKTKKTPLAIILVLYLEWIFAWVFERSVISKEIKRIFLTILQMKRSSITGVVCCCYGVVQLILSSKNY